MKSNWLLVVGIGKRLGTKQGGNHSKKHWFPTSKKLQPCSCQLFWGLLSHVCPCSTERDGLKNKTKIKNQIHFCHFCTQVTQHEVYGQNEPCVWPLGTWQEILATVSSRFLQFLFPVVQVLICGMKWWDLRQKTQWCFHLEKGAVTVQTIANEMHLPSPQGCFKSPPWSNPACDSAQAGFAFC